MKKTNHFLLILIATILCGSPVFSQSAAIQLEGVKSEVTVRRDRRSIPYIEAKSEADLYFAQGYTTASDRLFQMDLMRRLARGETAEIFGQLGLEEDKRWRKLGFGRICEESYKLLKPEVKNALDSYTRGVNAYIATLTPETMPVEYKVLQLKPREWVATDSIVIGRILSDALSNTWRQDLSRALVGQLPPPKAKLLTDRVTPDDVVLFGADSKTAGTSASVDSRDENTFNTARISASVFEQVERLEDARRASLERVGLYMEDQAASNNWVISGKHTADGKALLANDPHLQPTAPGIWYMVHLTAPDFRVSGVTLPGAPGVILGHNEHIAWGATNLGPDVQDIYVETGDTLMNAVVRKEQIKVRKNPLGPVTDQQITDLDVIETKNGVVYFEEGDKKYSLKWTAREPKNDELGAFFYLNRAKNWNEFNAALKQYGGATQNFVYADTAGNIGWHTAGAIPIRKKGDGSVPYDGATTDGDWTGTIPYDEMPHLYNPASGYIVTANQRVTGSSNKYFSILSRDAATPWRARRIVSMIEAGLAAKKKHSMDDSTAIHMDVTNVPLQRFAAEITKLGAASPETLAAIKDWDGKFSSDSKTALIVNEIRVVFAEKLAAGNMMDASGKKLGIPVSWVRERAALRVLQREDKTWLPKEYASYKDLLIDSEKQAKLNLNALVQRLNRDPVALIWEDYMAPNFMHPLASAPLIGGQFTVRPKGISGSGQTPNVGHFVSMRHIATPGNWDATRHVIPLGQSGDPKSPHFMDQFESWRTGKAEVFPFSREAVEKVTSVVMTMGPKK